ncbi:MAG: glycosyltransferase [Patescibacteria group bacterium]
MKARSLFIYFALYLISFALVGSIFLVQKSTVRISWIQTIIIFSSFVFLTKYLIYMIINPWHDALWNVWKKRNRAWVESYRPKVSVLIPAWNEEVGVLSTVKSILASTYDNIEVIVINDGSTDNSDAVMKEFVARFEEEKREGEKTIVYHYQENGGKGSALNRGIGLSTGEIIVTIDADSIAHPEAMTQFVSHFANPKVMAAVGNVKIGNTSSFVATVQSLEFLFSFYFKRADSVLGSIYIIGGAAGAFRREVFEKLGLYDQTNITEDIELSVRIQVAGMKIVYAAEAVVYTEGANDIRSLMKQRLRWKRGRIDTFIKYKKLFFSTKEGHNRFLSWFVLPFAVLGDSELLLEIPFIAFLYITSFITHDYSAFVAALLIVVFVFVMQIFTPDRKYNKTNVYLLAPIGWLMFYLVTFIEINAMGKSLYSLYANKAIKWQSWKRTGLTDIK